MHGFARDAAVGEAAFAADPSGDQNEDAEDAGYLMAYVADPERDASDLVILSAQDFTGPPVARVHLPARVPLGFHGNWIPDA
ncbi:carotenoid oxygenase family protein [Nonomuraea antimicrobica]